MIKKYLLPELEIVFINVDVITDSNTPTYDSDGEDDWGTDIWD